MTKHLDKASVTLAKWIFPGSLMCRIEFNCNNLCQACKVGIYDAVRQIMSGLDNLPSFV